MTRPYHTLTPDRRRRYPATVRPNRVVCSIYRCPCHRLTAGPDAPPYHYTAPMMARSCRRFARAILLLVTLGAAAAPPCQAGLRSRCRARSWFSTNRTRILPGIGISQRLPVGISRSSKTPVAIYSEVLELGRFNSPQHQQLLRSFLREISRQADRRHRRAWRDGAPRLHAPARRNCGRRCRSCSRLSIRRRSPASTCHPT